MKKFWKYGLLAAGLTAFVACGDDSSSASSKHEEGEQRKEVSLPKPSEGDTPAKINSFNADFNDPELSISAMIGIDPLFEPVEDRFYNIDSVVFVLAAIDGDKEYLDESLKLPSWTDGGKTIVTISENIDLASLQYGKYRLHMLTYTSDEREDGVKAAEKYLKIDSKDFEKENLTQDESSSSEKKCTAMDSVEVTLSTRYGDDVFELNFKTGSDENPHVSLNGQDLEEGDGVTIYEEKNSEDTSWEPELCAESFRKAPAPREDPVVMNTWYVAKTSDGEFPFYIKDISSAGKNGNTMTITYFKKK